MELKISDRLMLFINFESKIEQNVLFKILHAAPINKRLRGNVCNDCCEFIMFLNIP